MLFDNTNNARIQAAYYEDDSKLVLKKILNTSENIM